MDQYHFDTQRMSPYELEIANYKAMKKRSKILVTVCCAIYLIGCMTTLFFGIRFLMNKDGFAFFGKDNSYVSLLKVVNDAENRGYVLKNDEEIISFDVNGFGEGYMTRDREHIVIVDKGRMRLRLLDENGKTLLTSNCEDGKSYDMEGITNKAATVVCVKEDSLETIQNNIIDDYKTYNEDSDQIDIDKLIYNSKKNGYDQSIEGYLQMYEDIFDEDYHFRHECPKELYYCDYKKQSLVKISEDFMGSTISRYEEVVYFTTKDGLYRFDSSMEEPEKIYSRKRDRIDIEYISLSGDVAFWTDEDDDKMEVYSYSSKGVAQFAEFDENLFLTNIYRMDHKDNYCCVPYRPREIVYGNVDGHDSKKIIVTGEENVLNGFEGFTIYDEEGKKNTGYKNKTISSKGIYLRSDPFDDPFDEEAGRLYYISFKNNNSIKVDADVRSISYIGHGDIIFTTSTGNLMRAKLNKDTIEDVTLIDIGISKSMARVYVSDPSNIYYLKSKSTLYYWNGKVSQKVADNVFENEIYALSNGKCFYGVDPKHSDNASSNASSNAFSNAFSQDCDYAQKYYIADGTESTQIAENVLFVRSFDGTIDSEDVYLYCYDHMDMRNIFSNIYCYDGEKLTPMLENIKDPLK